MCHHVVKLLNFDVWAPIIIWIDLEQFEFKGVM